MSKSKTNTVSASTIGTPLSATSMPNLAKALMLPGESPPFRVPTYPNVEKTALLQFRTTATVPTVTASGSMSGVLIMPSPVVPVWATRLLNTVLVEYAASALPVPGAVATYLDIVTSGAWKPYAATVGIGTLPIYTRGLPFGVIAEDRFVYCPPDSKIFVNVTFSGVTGGSGSLVCKLLSWDGGEYLTTSTITLNATGTAGVYLGYLSEQNQVGVFHRIDFVEASGTYSYTGTATAVTATMGWMTGGTYTAPSGTLAAMLPLSVPPQTGVSTVQFKDTRLNALSVLCTNTTKVLYKEGTVNASRQDLRQTSAQAVWRMQDDVHTSVHPSLRYFGPLEHGLYSYYPPIAEQNNYRDHLFGSNAYPLLYLREIPVVQIGAFYDPDDGTNISLTADWHVEFRTTSTLFNLATCANSLDQYHLAVTAVSRCPPFTQNWVHVPAILAFLRTYGPRALKAAAYLAGYESLTTRTQKPASMARLPPRKTEATVVKAVLPPSGFLPNKGGSKRTKKSQRKQRRWVDRYTAKKGKN